MRVTSLSASLLRRVRHHDKYDQGYFVAAAQTYEQPKSSSGSCCPGENHT